ncbi:TetR family transcriptional regulator [Actinosynnema sp. NPDC023658]|uniref:TetR family transcriptional regulator n=1 Tax=Actinosynnema sp. NPDC023658 TaxID=3155465 RepID=UPI0033EA3B57
MAWNTEETRRRLKEAAVVEFAAHGLAGTRVERIAARAGVNKERLYNYFGDKEQLFTTVLSDEMAKIAAAVPLNGLRDVGDYAGRCFDYHVANPHLVRLLQWEALAYGDGAVPDEDGRAAHYRRKVEAFRAAQAEGVLVAGAEAADLVFMIMSLTSWWLAVPQVARMVTGAEGVARRRAAVVEAARRMASSAQVRTSD